MNYRVGILDRDTAYVTELMKYINSHGNIPLTLYAYSGEASMKEGIREHRLGLLLVGETIPSFEAEVPTVILSESGGGGRGVMTVYKYQSADGLATELVRCLKHFANTAETSGSMLVACLSAFGRCGCTTLAYAMCRIYKKSLYVNMETLQEAEYLDAGSRTDCNRLLYSVISGRGELLSMVQTPSHGAFDRLLDGTGFSELRELSAEHVAAMCKVFADTAAYHRLVFDIGIGSLSAWSVLEHFDRIYVPLPREGERKRGSLERMIEDEEIVKKLRYLRVPELPWDSDELADWIEGGGL